MEPPRGFDALAAELASLFRRGVDAPLDDAAFGRLALRVFRFQLGHNAVYRAFCEGRGATAESVADWRDVPPVPATAFQHLPLLSVPPDRVEAVFRTSGTSRGAGRRGEHRVASLDLYRASAEPSFAARVLHGLDVGSGPPASRPEGRRIPFLCFLPSPGDAPDSSLSAMAGFAVERWGSGASRWLVDPGAGLRTDAAREALRSAEAAGRPVAVLGTAFSFVHLLDEGVEPVRLPEGSRIMETGGFKGRSRVVGREELYRGLEERLGVPARRIVNEYGMTELLSQFYEPVLREAGDGDGAPGARRHVGPPWVRTRVLDPRTLAPLADGEPGLLCHHDLANLGSVAAVLTEDAGAAVPAAEGGGFRLLGRAAGAEPRGCSLAMEELMEAAGGR